jgi:regulator of protease activity HflC (stomatin/prohibitin superfamily)
MTTLLYILLYALIAAGLVFFILKKSIVYIPAEEEWIIERYNKYHRTAKPPFAFVLFDPIFDRIRKKVFMRGDKSEIKGMKIYTSDKVLIGVSAIIYYKVINSHDATYKIPDYKGGVERQAKGHIRYKIGTMILEDAILGRKDIKKFTEEHLAKDLDAWGVKLLAVEISDIDVPKEIQKALENKAIAIRQKTADMIKAQSKYEVAKKNAETHKIKLEEKIHTIEELSKVNHTGDANMPINLLLGEKYLEALQSLSSSDSSKFVVYPSDLQKSLKGLFTMNAIKEDNDD